MSKKENAWLTDKHWVTQHNYLDEVRSQFTLPEKVRIHDVTLREAGTGTTCRAPARRELRIYEALDEMGVYSVELFPLYRTMTGTVAKELVKMRRKTKTKVFFLCRWHKEEVDLPLKRGPMVSSSKARRIHGLRMSHSMG